MGPNALQGSTFDGYLGDNPRGVKDAHRLHRLPPISPELIEAIAASAESETIGVLSGLILTEIRSLDRSDELFRFLTEDNASGLHIAERRIGELLERTGRIVPSEVKKHVVDVVRTSLLELAKYEDSTSGQEKPKRPSSERVKMIDEALEHWTSSPESLLLDGIDISSGGIEFEEATLEDIPGIIDLYQEVEITGEKAQTVMNPHSDEYYGRKGGMFAIPDEEEMRALIEDPDCIIIVAKGIIDGEPTVLGYYSLFTNVPRLEDSQPHTQEVAETLEKALQNLRWVNWKRGNSRKLERILRERDGLIVTGDIIARRGTKEPLGNVLMLRMWKEITRRVRAGELEVNCHLVYIYDLIAAQGINSEGGNFQLSAIDAIINKPSHDYFKRVRTQELDPVEKDIKKGNVTYTVNSRIWACTGEHLRSLVDYLASYYLRGTRKRRKKRKKSKKRK